MYGTCGRIDNKADFEKHRSSLSIFSQPSNHSGGGAGLIPHQPTVTSYLYFHWTMENLILIWKIMHATFHSWCICHIRLLQHHWILPDHVDVHWWFFSPNKNMGNHANRITICRLGLRWLLFSCTFFFVCTSFNVFKWKKKKRKNNNTYIHIHYIYTYIYIKCISLLWL